MDDVDTSPYANLTADLDDLNSVNDGAGAIVVSSYFIATIICMVKVIVSCPKNILP